MGNKHRAKPGAATGKRDGMTGFPIEGFPHCAYQEVFQE